MTRRPEFVPAFMVNNNGFEGHQPNCPMRRPLPPQGMVEVGNSTVPLFVVHAHRMFAPHQTPHRMQNNSGLLMVQEPGQRPAPAFGRSIETDFDEVKPSPGCTQVNFALCKERFSGIGDVRPFINAVIDFKNFSEMNDETALRSFPLLLTDHATNWWQNNKTKITDWDNATKLLRNAFRVRTELHKIYRRLFSTPQTEEPTEVFVLKSKVLLNKIPVNTFTKETQLDIVYALLNRRIKDKVEREDCDSFTDLVERARRVEEAIAGSSPRAPVRPQPLVPCLVRALPQAPVRPQIPALPQVLPPTQAAAAPQSSEENQVPAPPQASVEPQSPEENQAHTSPQVSSSPQVSQLPQVPATPQAAATPQAPVEPQSPEENQLPAPPQAPVEPQSSEENQVPAPPQAAVEPQSPEVNQVPAPPQAATVPQAPEENQVPAPPQAAAVPQAPVEPQSPEENQVPAPPQAPVEPQSPEENQLSAPLQAAVEPQSPEENQVHTSPQVSQLPQVPATPQAAATSQAPVEPQSPEENQLPAPPQAPVEPQSSEENQVPAPSHAAVVPQAPVEPQSAENNQAPALPQVSASPQVPELPQVPAPPQASAAPQSPEESEESRASETPCDHCKLYGQLFERTCRKLHRGEKTAQNIQLLEELSQLDAEKRTKMVCFRCRSENIVRLKCRNCLRDVSNSCPMINVNMYDMDFNIVVDTGSSHSIASMDLIRHLIAHGQHFTFKLLIMPIMGVPTRQVFRVATVEVMAAGVRIPTMFIDLPGTVTTVFGMDFIQRAGLVFDFRGIGSWTVRGATGPDQALICEQLNRLQ